MFTQLQLLTKNLDPVMIRAMAVALVALAAFDLYFLDGKYTHSVEAIARLLIHFVVG